MNKNEFLNIKNILIIMTSYKKNNIYVDKRLEDYSENFGIQWKEFSKTQLDSFTGFLIKK